MMFENISGRAASLYINRSGNKHSVRITKSPGNSDLNLEFKGEGAIRDQ
jgi:hypothetical protein